MTVPGYISDNEICESGFYYLLKKLSIMADKGFRIENELAELNVQLNIPALESSASQISPGDVALTRRIAGHRLHVERYMYKVNKFQNNSKANPRYFIP